MTADSNGHSGDPIYYGKHGSAWWSRKQVTLPITAQDWSESAESREQRLEKCDAVHDPDTSEDDGELEQRIRLFGAYLGQQIGTGVRRNGHTRLRNRSR